MKEIRKLRLKGAVTRHSVDCELKLVATEFWTYVSEMSYS